MKAVAILTLSIFASFLSSAPPAQQVSGSESSVVATVNGWQILDDRGRCSAATTYGRSTFVYVSYNYGNNSAYLVLANPAWESVRDQQRYQIKITFSDGSSYSSATAYGLRTEGTDHRTTGLSVSFDGRDFLEAFAGTAGVRIEMGSNLLANLSLSGTRAMVQRLTRCAIDSFVRYPPDPFREPEPNRSPSLGGSTAVGQAFPQPTFRSIGSYFSSDDYPAAALRANEQGRTSVHLVIDSSGRVSNCIVATSSGSISLDSATCRIIRSRARFNPTRDRDGNATTGQFDTSVNWRLPADEIPVTQPPTSSLTDVVNSLPDDD